jgi:hypothetical protein
LRLMRILASGNVDHTTLNQPLKLNFFRRLPITIFWYAEVLFLGAGAVWGQSAANGKALFNTK